MADIGALDASYNKTYEIGYKGIIGNKLRLAVDGWVQKRGDVGNPAGIATPNVFFNGQQLGAFLGPNIAQILIQAGVPAAQAAAAAQQIAPQIATAAASLPVGIVQFNNGTFANGTDVYATYTSSTNKEITVKAFQTQLKAIKRWGRGAPDDLSKLTQPTLIANGDNDRMVPSVLSEDLHRRIAGSRLIIYPDSGHGGIFQFHDQFAPAVVEFLGR